MKNSRKAGLALIAAIAGIAFSVTPAFSQIRVDTAGHALDANNQVGSGGYNAQSSNQQSWSQYQNAITTNSTSGAYGFRGHTFNDVNLGVGYTDPFAFRGLLAGQGVDQFIAESTGVPTMADPTASSRNYAAPANPGLTYYGTANHSSAPNGFQSNSTGQGYVPIQTPTPQAPQDPRIGAIDFSGSNQVIPKPYEMILPGPVDPTADPATPAQQMLAANPIFGVVNWSMTPGQQQSQSNSPNSVLGQTPLQQGISPQVAQGLTQQQLNDLRQQLAGMASSSASNQPTNTGTPNASNPLAGGNMSSLNQPLNQGNTQSSQLPANNLIPTAGDMSTGQSNRQSLVGFTLPPPGQQSALYAKLRKTINDYNSNHSMTDEQANQKFREILRLRAQATLAAENGANVLTGPNAGAQPNSGAVPGPMQPIAPDVAPQSHPLKPSFNTVPQNMGPGPDTLIPPVSPQPVPVDSFSKDIPAKGLADLIAGGDVDVQNAQYDKAIAAYNQAIDVVPNNPLILVARSIAELGGGYYAQANSDLHAAIADDPAVLMGQYDLQKQFGEPRLRKVIGELKDIATSSKDNTLHSFLLTFCYYNSRHIGQAADWLQITDQRSGGQDPAIVQMKKYWNFSDEAPIPVPAPVQPHRAITPQSAGPATQPAFAH
jgi:tetratricopeptide (TPR) repeat protein